MTKRHMPTIISGNPMQSELLPDSAIVVPTLPANEWNTRVRRICSTVLGRDLTTGELAEIEDCVAHNWTLRVTVDHIIGRDLTNDEWEELK